MTTVNTSPADTAAGSTSLDESGTQSIVVVGNGPVGFRFVQGMVERQLHRRSRISVFGEENCPAYDRVNLTRFLDDPSPTSLQYEPRSWYESHDISLYTGDPVVSIDRHQKLVRSKSGRVVSYDRLVLATGSRPFLPPVPGIDQEGVFAYRTLEDLSGIQEFATHCRRAVVLGGGLLGLEAAEALTRLGLSVFVVEMASVLMPRQLDNAGATLLKKMVESSRMKVLLQRQTEKISRIEEGLHVQFSNSEGVVADMVVVSAGIRPRDELARDCDLAVGKRGGIAVNDHLLTEDPAVSAIGECAEHDGHLYGLAAPGYRMANTLVDRLRGMDAAFFGSNEATRLKLVGINVVFSGDYLDTSRAATYVRETSTCYIKLVVRNGRLTGLIGVGDVPQFDRLQEAIERHRQICWWHIRRFEATGRLWKGPDSVDLRSWPATAVVCSCTGVTHGCLRQAMARGNTTTEALAASTKASTVCGSCLPLIQQLAGETATTGRTGRSHAALAGLSCLALVLIGLLVLLPPVALPVSVQTTTTVWQTLITNAFWKQVTGYSLLSLVVLSLVVSLRKRTQLLQRFQFTSLRVVHVFLATSALGVLMAHTGFHRGTNLNFALFCTFIAASLTGAVVGILAGTESRLPPGLRMLRRPMTLWHILCLWPLPLLIAFHIVSVYWL